MSLDELLREIRQRRLILTYGRTGRVVLWSPNCKTPARIRSAISAHNPELQKLLARSEIIVCPNPDLHRASWGYYVSRYACDCCARLRPSVSA